jgi:DNA-directed RNA polymerase omega subunit
MLDNDFLLAMMVAKRAKELRGGAKILVETKHRKPVKIALEEIKAGKVFIKKDEEPLKAEQIFNEGEKPEKVEDMSDEVKEPEKVEDMSDEVKEPEKVEDMSDEVKEPEKVEGLLND